MTVAERPRQYRLDDPGDTGQEAGVVGDLVEAGEADHREGYLTIRWPDGRTSRFPGSSARISAYREGGPVCDFCQAPDPPYSFAARDAEAFSLEEARPADPGGGRPSTSSVTSTSLGRWGACEDCRGLIERRDFAPLVERVARALSGRLPGMPMPVLREAVMVPIGAFLTGWTGDRADSYDEQPVDPLPHTLVEVPALPPCDLCKSRGADRPALYDAKTKMGPWANLCQQHMDEVGVGLGLGRGQRLEVRS